MANQTKEKGLSPLDIFMIGFGALIGVAWAVSSNNWTKVAGGPIPATIGFLLCCIVLIAIGLCYAELTTAMPVAGGLVVYSYKAFGTFPSFVAGWLLVMSYVIMIPWESIYISDVMGILFPALKQGTLLYTLAGTDIYLRSVVVGILMSILIAVLNWYGADIAGKFQTFLGIALLGCAIIVIVACFAKADFANLTPVYQNVGTGNHSNFFGGALAMMAIVPMYMSGFDTIPQGIEDAGGKVTSKVIVWAMVGCIIAASAFYCLIVLATNAAMNWQEYSTLSSPAAALIFHHIGYGPALSNILYWVSMIGALTGLITTWNSFYIAASRFLMSLGRARLIPKWFASMNSHNTPAGGAYVCAAASFIGPFLGVGMIDPLTSVGSLGFIFGWACACFSLIRLRKTDPDMPRPFKVPGGMGMAWFAALGGVFIVLMAILPFSPGFMGNLAILLFVIWVVIGLILYALAAKVRAEVTEEERMALMFSNVHEADT